MAEEKDQSPMDKKVLRQEMECIAQRMRLLTSQLDAVYPQIPVANGDFNTATFLTMKVFKIITKLRSDVARIQDLLSGNVKPEVYPETETGLTRIEHMVAEEAKQLAESPAELTSCDRQREWEKVADLGRFIQETLAKTEEKGEDQIEERIVEKGAANIQD